jgi:CRP-like cAMP-binding protein
VAEHPPFAEQVERAAHTVRRDTVNKLWFLRRLDLFEGLSEAQIDQVAALMRDRACAAGEDVTVRPSGDRIYVIKKGRVRVHRGDLAVAVLGPGQIFGTSAFFGAAVIGQRVVAVDPDVLVCDAPAAKFLQIMATHPGLAASSAWPICCCSSPVAIERVCGSGISRRPTSPA